MTWLNDFAEIYNQSVDPQKCQTLKAETSFADNFALFTLSYYSGEHSVISPPQICVLSMQNGKIHHSKMLPTTFETLQVQEC